MNVSKQVKTSRITARKNAKMARKNAKMARKNAMTLHHKTVHELRAAKKLKKKLMLEEYPTLEELHAADANIKLLEDRRHILMAILSTDSHTKLQYI